VQGNIKDSFRWLRNHGGADVIGIAAIDTTKAYNSRFAISVAPSLEEALDRVNRISDDTATYWQVPAHRLRQGYEGSVHAVLFRFGAVAVEASERTRIRINTRWAFCAYSDGESLWERQLKAAMAAEYASN